MTPKFAFCAVLLCTTFCCFSQNLVAYYPFTGNANDASGNGNNASVNGATLTTDRFGTAANAYLFDGNDAIEAPNSASLQLTTDYTISAYVNVTVAPPPADGGTVFTIVSKDVGQGMNNPKWIFGLQNGKLAYHINGPGYGNGYWLYSNAFTLNLNQWYRFTMSKAGNIVQFYADNISLGSFTLPASSYDPAAPLSIGASKPCCFMNGSIDEVRIYNRSVTAAELVTLPVRLTAFTCAAQPTGNLLQWRVEEEGHTRAYRLEKSNNGVDFFALQTFASERKVYNTYSYVDKTKATPAFYRLQLTDEGGRNTYSNVLRITPKNAPGIAASFVPAQNNLQLRWQGLPSGKYTLQLVDAAGRKVHVQTISITGDSTLHTAILPALLHAGFYSVVLSSAKDHFAYKFLVLESR